MKLFIISLLVGYSSITSAIDYSLCSEYLERETPKTYLKMNEKGEIRANDQKEISHYEETEEGKNITLGKSWQNKTTPSIKEYVQVRVSKSDSGDITIHHVAGSNTEILQVLQYPPYGAFNSNMNMQASSSFYKNVKPIGQVSTTVQLKIKNGKCFPKEVNYSSTLFPQAGTIGQNMNFSSTANTEKCREILDFYKNNPTAKNCSNTDSLKRLKEILGYSAGTWAVSNELLKEIDDKLTEANKLVEISTRELNKCNNAKLTPSIKDEDLWRVTNPSNSDSSRDNSPSAVIAR
tara:strand:+ start:147 stop:1022 length:876 start_codon:yes stop_codon:yes gene_type:complete